MPDVVLSLEDAKETLRTGGLRCTPARIAVLQCLAESPSPQTPAEIVSQVARFGFDRSTVYRSLTELTAARIVHRLDLGDSQRRFELRLNKDPEHPHFMCLDCGEVLCLADFTVELRPGTRKKKTPGVISEVLVRGRCNTCVAEN